MEDTSMFILKERAGFINDKEIELGYDTVGYACIKDNGTDYVLYLDTVEKEKIKKSSPKAKETVRSWASKFGVNLKNKI